MIPAVLLLSFGASLTVTGGPLASQPGTITVSDDWPSIALTVDNLAAVAFAQRFQRFGVRVDVNGVTLPAHLEVGNELTIEESADSFGDRLTLKLAGEKYSPFARKLLQTKAPITVYFRTGSPGNEFLAKVFTGFIVSATYDGHPPVATVTALDAAGLYAEKRAKDWSLPPNSGRTRLSINLELLAIGGIPVRAIDLGLNGGGTVNKPHTLGDRPILDFLRDFDAVVGAEIGFEEGGFVARRYDANQPAVLELNPGNVIADPPAFSLTAPDTLAANILGVVSTSSTRTEIGGYVTEDPLRVVVTGPYAPDTAVEMIDGGVVTATGLAPVEAVQTISESITTVTKFGGVAVLTERLERGWLAERAAGAQVVSVVEDPESFDIDPVPGKVYVFPDGSTRAVIRETFRDLAHTVTTKDLDEQNRVIRVREERDKYRMYARSIFEVGEAIGDPVPLSDDGQGMQYPREVMRFPLGLSRPTELDVTEYELNEAGEIVTETKTERFHELPAKVRHANEAHAFGTDQRTYHADRDEAIVSVFDSVLPWRGLRVTTKSYQALDEDSYQITESVRVGNKAPTATTSDPIIGSLPRPEKAEPSQSTQEIRATYEDQERIALAGEEIEDIEHNEFIETLDEAEVYARHRARLASAVVLTCAMPIEGLIHKWRRVRVDIPNGAIDGLLFSVRSVHRDAATFSQSVVAHFYSPLI